MLTPKAILGAVYDGFDKLINTSLSRFSLLAQSLILTSLLSASKGTLLIHLPDKQDLLIGKTTCASNSNRQATLTIHSPSFWTRVLLSGDIGFAEAYMLDEISTPDPTAVFEFFIHNAAHLNTTHTSGTTTTLRNLTGWFTRRANTVTNAKLNACAHYSLSNDMFAAFLSRDMTYSAPLWLPKSEAEADTLEEAQMRKLRYAVKAVHLKATDHVLEIGAGWGSFAILAARETGCRVTTVTPSAAQKELVEQRVRDAGLQERVTVVLADYRELKVAEKERFDKVVSIEMIEHVGHSFLETYFACMDKYLKKEGGIGYFQSITIPEARYETYLKGEDFIRKYIFPGGHLPTVSGLVSSIDKGSKGTLVVEEIKSFGGHYAKALRSWREKFVESFEGAAVPALKRAHPDMTKKEIQIFKRKWEYYFCYCEAGFKTKILGDVGITVAREGCVELLEDIPL